MCRLVLLATYVISWWCHLKQTITTHTLQPLNAYHPQTPLIIMANTNCLHEGCQRKPMTHGNGYCHLHGDCRKCTYPQCSNYVQPDGVCVQYGNKKNNARAMDAPTMPWGMGFASIMVQSAIALCLSVERHCFRQGSADITLMVVNNSFNWLVGGGHYSSSKCDSWYAPWGNFYNLRLCRWWTKIWLHQSSHHNHGHYQINSRLLAICGDE